MLPDGSGASAAGLISEMSKVAHHPEVEVLSAGYGGATTIGFPGWPNRTAPWSQGLWSLKPSVPVKIICCWSPWSRQTYRGTGTWARQDNAPAQNCSGGRSGAAACAGTTRSVAGPDFPRGISGPAPHARKMTLRWSGPLQRTTTTAARRTTRHRPAASGSANMTCCCRPRRDRLPRPDGPSHSGCDGI